METQTPEMDLNLYDVIFKTVYLVINFSQQIFKILNIVQKFLESNDFQQTALSFLNEIEQKYHQDVNLNNTTAKTLILRPLYNDKDSKSCSRNNDKLIVSFPGDDRTSTRNFLSLPILNLPDAKRRTVIFQSQTSNKLPTQTRSSTQTQCVHDPTVIPNPSCPDCQRIVHSQEEYDKFCQLAVSFIDDNDKEYKEASFDWNEIRTLGESIRDLHDNHQRLINLATDLTCAIGNLNSASKDHLLSKYHQQIYELYSYPGSHHNTIDVVLMLQEQDDKTEYQVESSVINSSNNITNQHNSYNDLFIPLESKRVVGDIPTLIANPQSRNQITTSDTSGTSMTSNMDSASTTTNNQTSLLSDEHTSSAAPTRFYKVNKSATLPALKVDSAIEARNKSRSASYLETNKMTHKVEKALRMEHANGNGDAPKERLNQLHKQLEHLLLIQQDQASHASRTSIVINYTETGAAGEVEDSVPRGQDVSESDNSEYETCDANAGELDWVLLKRTLFEGDGNVKVKLLQALRWRLTKANKAQRDKHLLDYVKHDILSINSIPPYGQLFLESFYCPTKIPTPHPLQEEMARFINTLASLSMGRLYLERDESVLSVMLLPLLMGKLPGIKIFDLTREFTMATVQKLSLSNKMREVIIAAGTVEWLIGFIEKNHSNGLQTTYEAEYSVALLTNLCINKEARNRCERVADRVVSVIMDLIATPHKCCIHYINPILYSLLLNPLINEKAVARGIGIRLKDLYTVFKDDDELKRQLDAILIMHETHDFCECDDCDTEDLNSQNYADYLEPDLNQHEGVFGPPVGEDLLRTFLNTSTPNVSKSKSELIKRLSSVQIVKKNCVCNNKSISRIEHKLIEETIAVKPRPGRTTNRQRPPANGGRETSNNRSIPEAKTTRTLKTKSDRFVPQFNKTSKTLIRRRSLSQPPTNLKSKIAPKVDTRRKLTDFTAAQPKTSAHAKMPKVKKYIVNCCYKMDYSNAIAAPPGAFVPRPLPSLPLPVDSLDQRSCPCYNEMKSFMHSFEKASETKTDGCQHGDKTVKNELASSLSVKCANCQHSMPVLQMESFPSMDSNVLVKTKAGKYNTQQLQLTDYHVLSSGTESAILGAYKPKIKR